MNINTDAVELIAVFFLGTVAVGIAWAEIEGFFERRRARRLKK